MLAVFAKFYKIEFIIDNLKDHYWNVLRKWTGEPRTNCGLGELNSVPILEIIL